MIGRDDPSKVLTWIEERITCLIPDQENNPELVPIAQMQQLLQKEAQAWEDVCYHVQIWISPRAK